MNNGDINRKITGAVIRADRVRAGYKQAEAAKMLGLTQSHLSMLECGKRRLSVEMAEKMRGLYGEGDICADGCAETPGVRTVRLLEELAEKSDSETLARSVDWYIALCGYMALRKLYLANPHNTETIFSVGQDVLQKLSRTLADEPEKLAKFAAESKEVRAQQIEPDEEQRVRLLEIVRDCEREILKAVGGEERFH